MTNDASSIGPVHFQLQAPHADFVDFYRLQQMLVVPFFRQKTRKYTAIGFLIGGMAGLVVVLTAYSLGIWVRPSFVLGLGDASAPIVARGLPFWITVVALVLAVLILNGISSKMLAKATTRAMFEASLRNFPMWSLALGENGFQMTIGGTKSTVPWTSISAFHQGKTASFLIFKAGVNGVVLSHGAFANADERHRCLAFLEEKIPGQKP